jgi:hypothetical protein
MTWLEWYAPQINVVGSTELVVCEWFGPKPVLMRGKLLASVESSRPTTWSFSDRIIVSGMR